MYADIIIDITHEKLDKVFQYRVPEELEGDLRTGGGVIVQFGRGNRETKGYIVGFSETCDYDAEKIKDILRTDTSSVAIEARLVALAAWMKEYYGGTMIQALKTVLPIKRTEQQKEQRILKRCISREAGEKKLEEYLHKNQKARARLMAALLDDEEVEYSIVGSAEADPMNFKISNESPVGSALVGKKVGDIVEVESPNGVYKIEIIDIK